MPSQTTTPIIHTGSMSHQRTGTDLVHQCTGCGAGNILGWYSTASAIQGALAGNGASGETANMAAAYGICGGTSWLEAWPTTTPAPTIGTSSGIGKPIPAAVSRQKTVR